MELFPKLASGWLNGWVFLGLLCLVEGACFLLFPKAVVKRLFDRSGWSQKQVVFTVIGKVAALVCLILLIFTPLKPGAPVFVAGSIVVALGAVGLLVALLNFKNTPPDQPVSQGIYKISRHPQIVMSSVMLLGTCIAVGSWAALIALVVARIFSHLGILAEEEVCLKQYGDSYRAYVQRVPRYFVFF
ncbi:MAG: isoprenylcysteine carboxylmethyltransferase family protein [Anaerolineae bacterium]|nr:isoprenylcysteine carboxylmethyltransferase family protein [Anaerolineae bacterium]